MNAMRANQLLDKAFKRAKTCKAQTFKERAISKITTINDIITSSLDRESRFVDISSLDSFYKKLLDTKIGIVKLKKALSMIYKSKTIISNLSKTYKHKIQRSEPMIAHKLLREFYGRTSSIVKSLENSLETVFMARQCLKKSPKLKDMFTACIIGFPNVGKTTLFSKLTSSKPEIGNYAFTTTDINVGYIKINEIPIVQVLDAPGTLNRINKMNNAELLAWIAMETSDIIVFVFDTGMDLKKQLELRGRIMIFKKHVVDYISKTDIFNKKTIKEFVRKLGLKNYYTDPNKIKKLLINLSLKQEKE